MDGLKRGVRVRVVSGVWVGEEAVVVSTDDRGVKLRSTVRETFHGEPQECWYSAWNLEPVR